MTATKTASAASVDDDSQVIAAGVLAAVDLGYAICNHLDTTQDPDATANYMMSLGHRRANANMWLAASVINLCPELNHLTGY